MGGTKSVYFCTSSENLSFDKKGSLFSAIIIFLSFYFLNGAIPKLRDVFLLLRKIYNTQEKVLREIKY